MVIFLCGDDSYRRQKKEKELVSVFLEKNPGASVNRFDAEEDIAAELHGFLGCHSLFETKKMAIVVGLADGLASIFKSYLKDEENWLIISAERKEKGFAFLEKKPAVFQPFSKLKGEERLAFLKKEAEERNAKISLAALKILSRETDDLWEAISEMEKLSLLEKEEIDAIDAEQFLEKKVNPDIFDFISRVKFRRPGALAALSRLEFCREEPAKVFNILASQMPSRASYFADLDIGVKSGKFDYEEALTLVALTAVN